MLPALDSVTKVLKKLPGLGYRSAERLALHLLVERPEELNEVVAVLQEASGKVQKCERCGSIAEEELCSICKDPARDHKTVNIVEHVLDVFAMERSGAYKGVYHVLGGKLSPMKGIGPELLNLKILQDRIKRGEIEEIILSISNDIEGEATCHYLQDQVIGEVKIPVKRIGFGLPSGGSLLYADPATLQSALEGRRDY